MNVTSPTAHAYSNVNLTKKMHFEYGMFSSLLQQEEVFIKMHKPALLRK